MNCSDPNPRTLESLSSYLERRRADVDAYLDRCLPAESAYPAEIHRGMRYSVMAGGKRLRPVLAILVCETLGGKLQAVMPSAAALEMIHTYSLIHDDLPCMDNDDFRRGRPTLHKIMGDAMALLAGDALLTLAFEVVAKETTEPAILPRLIAEIGRAAGTRGMVGGQVMDLKAEQLPPSLELLQYIHLHKTAAMIRASALVGAIAARATPETVRAIEHYGENLGLAFQVVDDILDVEGDSVQLGKTAGKDAKQHKLTYPSLLGLEASKAKASELVASAKKHLESVPQSRLLSALADFVVERRS